MDNFYTKDKCDRCGGSLFSGRIMSMFNEECICMKCKSEEVQRPDYAEAVIGSPVLSACFINF